MSPAQKQRQKGKDSAKFGAMSIDGREVKGFIKLKLSEELVDTLADFVEDPEAEVKLGLSPTKVYKQDLFVAQIVESLKTNLGHKYKINFISEDAEYLEYKRVRDDTLTFNGELSGKQPDKIVILKDAFKDKEFIEKMKAKVSYNSLLEAHIEGIPEDEDVLELRER